jgi:hypothetical protein
MWMVQQVAPVTMEENRLYRMSVSTPDWACAATITFLRCLEPVVLEVLRQAGWLITPIEHWIAAFKDVMDGTRRCGIMGLLASDVVYSMRKVFNVTTRTLVDADWATEDRERQSWAVPKRIPWVGGHGMGSASWFDCLVSSTRRTWRQLLTRVVRDEHVQGLQDWWDRRHHWVASGSSAIRAAAEKKLVDDRWRSSDRASKKMVVETLPANYAWEVLYNSHPVDIARCSMKPEPGGKQRALIASDEAAYFAGAYSSVHLEKGMAFNGLLGKQMPADTLTWCQHHQVDNGYWLSLDYSNFNIEHAKWELGVVNALEAEIWAEVGAPAYVADKVQAAMWVSTSQDKCWYRRGEEWFRVTNGLNSGSRDTLRDNNMMHRAYADGAMELARWLGFAQEPLYEGFVGDDEDRKEPSLHSCIGYSWGVKMTGHRVNPRKQMTGRRHHEFLQRMLWGDNMPQRPLPMILATLASGNWYVEKGSWFDSAVSSSSDNFWECVCRGMPVGMAQKLAAMMLDQLFTVSTGIGKHSDKKTQLVRLEWWKYRHGGGESGYHPLWKSTGGVALAVPKIASRPQPRANWPKEASLAWMKHLEPILSQLRESRSRAYLAYLQQESVGGSFHHYRQRVLRDTVLREWPHRTYRHANAPWRKSQGGGVTQPPLSQILGMAGGATASRRPFDRAQMESLVGIDPYLSNQVGATIDLYARLGFKEWGRFAEIVPRPKVSPLVDVLESSLRAWFSSYPHPHPGFSSLEEKPPIPLRCIYFYAGAGSGKSWVTSRDDRFTDMDIAVYQTSGWQYRRGVTQTAQGWEHMPAQRAIRWALHGGQIWICGQWPPVLMERAGQSCVPQVEIVTVGVEPGVELRRNRLAMREKWDEPKIARYLKEFAIHWVSIPADRRFGEWGDAIKFAEAC